eukprot:TRINITY_DN8450_c0_g2_i2.p1 TRINITY_DN8450_c0_g2~~TRINITY_DN8450_c0_g2_i2.p1  ORF type:complete len:296 (-),score=46.85 TRINITY_DN8450_c0_g2_i2:4-891(-)
MSETQDLSKIHQPINNLITPTLTSNEEYQKVKLSTEQINFFHENGYVKLPVLTTAQVDLLLADLLKLTKDEESELWYEFHANEGDSENILFHSLGAWRISPLFHDLIWHPAFTVPCSQLLGDSPKKVRFWHDQLFCKPPSKGGNVAWHQDYSYWTRTKPMAHLTVHVALDDQTEDNGCLLLVPGSHKWPLLPITSLHFTDMDSIQTVLTDEQKKYFNPISLHLKRGEACLFHPLMVHGSYSNRSDGPRRSTVVNVFADGVFADFDGEILKGVKVEKGHKLEGQFFPVIFDPEKAF